VPRTDSVSERAKEVGGWIMSRSEGDDKTLPDLVNDSSEQKCYVDLNTNVNFQRRIPEDAADGKGRGLSDRNVSLPRSTSGQVPSKELIERIREQENSNTKKKSPTKMDELNMKRETTPTFHYKPHQLKYGANDNVDHVIVLPNAQPFPENMSNMCSENNNYFLVDEESKNIIEDKERNDANNHKETERGSSDNKINKEKESKEMRGKEESGRNYIVLDASPIKTKDHSFSWYINDDEPLDTHHKEHKDEDDQVFHDPPHQQNRTLETDKSRFRRKESVTSVLVLDNVRGKPNDSYKDKSNADTGTLNNNNVTNSTNNRTSTGRASSWKLYKDVSSSTRSPILISPTSPKSPTSPTSPTSSISPISPRSPRNCRSVLCVQRKPSLSTKKENEKDFAIFGGRKSSSERFTSSDNHSKSEEEEESRRNGSRTNNSRKSFGKRLHNDDDDDDDDDDSKSYIHDDGTSHDMSDVRSQDDLEDLKCQYIDITNDFCFNSKDDESTFVKTNNNKNNRQQRRRTKQRSRCSSVESNPKESPQESDYFSAPTSVEKTHTSRLAQSKRLYGSLDCLYPPSKKTQANGANEGRGMFAGYSYLSLHTLPPDHEIVKAQSWEVRARELELELNLIRKERRRVREELLELEAEEERFRRDCCVQEQVGVKSLVIPQVFGKANE